MLNSSNYSNKCPTSILVLDRTPRVSIERTDRILVYGPSKPSSLSSTEAWLKTTILLVDLGKKLGMDMQIGQSACCGLCRKQ
jgi:hypothetical protein